MSIGIGKVATCLMRELVESVEWVVARKLGLLVNWCSCTALTVCTICLVDGRGRVAII